MLERSRTIYCSHYNSLYSFVKGNRVWVERPLTIPSRTICLWSTNNFANYSRWNRTRKPNRAVYFNKKKIFNHFESVLIYMRLRLLFAPQRIVNIQLMYKYFSLPLPGIHYRQKVSIEYWNSSTTPQSVFFSTGWRRPQNTHTDAVIHPVRSKRAPINNLIIIAHNCSWINTQCPMCGWLVQ